nr:MAG TPA: hypothetical protein [Caudoviricetes sp.]
MVKLISSPFHMLSEIESIITFNKYLKKLY